MRRHLHPSARPIGRRFLAPVALTLTLSLTLVATARAAEPAATVAVADAGLEVVESKGSYESQGKTIAVDRFEPKAPGTYPVVLVVHGAGGMAVGGPWYREAARGLARRGYVAHVVHYFDLTSTRIADRPTMVAKFAGWMKAVADGITAASKRPNADPKRVGLLGFSLGSYLSLSLAMYDPRVSAVVEYFGGFPDVLVKDLKTLPPTLILHGDADLIVPVAQARALEALCKAKSVPYEIRIYPGQGHGFLGEEARDAARRAREFFDTHVKEADPSKTRATAAIPSPDAIAGIAKLGSGGK